MCIALHCIGIEIDKLIKIELNEVLMNEAQELLKDLTELLSNPNEVAMKDLKSLSKSLSLSKDAKRDFD